MELLSVVIGGVVLDTWVLVLLLSPLLFVLYTYAIHSGYSKENPIVWSWIPFMRSAIDFGKDPNTFLRECKEKYGSTFTVNLGGKLMTFVTDPQNYPHITKAREGLAFFEVAAGVAETVLAQSHDFCNDRDLDALVHQQYAKYLTGASLDEITLKYQEYLQEWFASHYSRETPGVRGHTGILDLATRAIFSASTRALFGDYLVDSAPNNKSFDANFSDDFIRPHKLLSTFQEFDNAFPMLYGGLPHFLLKKGVEARNNLVNSLRGLRKNCADFMTARQELMVESPPHPRPATDAKDFGASQLGMLWALQGNTIPATFWVIFFLRQHPEELERVQKEIRDVLREANKDIPNKDKFRNECNRDDLKKMVLLDAAISESLRMATGSMMMRRATQDLTLDLPTGPLKLKKGANVAIYPFLTHHDPKLYADPEKFDLNRWVDKPVEGGTITDVDGNKVPNGFMPFGSGISLCPGRHFARNEIKMFLVVFFNLFDLFNVEGEHKLKHPGYLLSRAGLGIFPPAKDVSITYLPKKL